MNDVDSLDVTLAASVFEITVASATVQLTDRKGDASYSTRNLTSRPVRAKAQPVVTPPAVESWLVVDQPERDLSPGVVQQIPIHIRVPKEVPAGTYGFRLDLKGIANPDEEFAQGPGVTFTVPSEPVVVRKTDRRWLWFGLAAAAAVLIAGGVVAYVLLRNVTVPSVVGQTLPSAQATLQAASLSVGDTSEQVTGQPEQTVLRQSPAAATPAPRNSAVDLVLEAARVAVPNVTGKSRTDGINALTAVGLTQGTITDAPTGKPPGTIIQQTPAAGAPVLRGSAVNLVLEAPLVSVPNLMNASVDAASQALAQAGLRRGVVKNEISSGTPNGTVSQQNPPAGRQVLRGSAVDLIFNCPTQSPCIR